MCSPEVWEDAKPLIEARAALLGIPVAWPNEAFEEPKPFKQNGAQQHWLSVRVEGDVSEAIEIGDGMWEETGTIHLDVMIPRGEGIDAGLVTRKEVVKAFRNLQMRPVIYGGIVLDPGGPRETDGRWQVLMARVAYSYQENS